MKFLLRKCRNVSTGATGSTAVAPKFSDTLTLSIYPFYPEIPSCFGKKRHKINTNLSVQGHAPTISRSSFKLFCPSKIENQYDTIKGV